MTEPDLIKVGYPASEMISDYIPEGVCLDRSSRSVVLTMAQSRTFYKNVIICSYIIRFFSVIETISYILQTGRNHEIITLVIPFPIIGFVGAKYLHKGLLVVYGIYLLFLIMLTIAITKEKMFHSVPLTSYVGVYSFDILVVFGLLKGLKILTKCEKDALRSVENCCVVPSIA